jgi:hypothetical protein
MSKMPKMYSDFKTGDYPIRPCLLPYDYAARLQTKFSNAFDIPALINPNAWAVNPDDSRQMALTGLWKAAVDIRNERLAEDGYPYYDGTLLMPLRTAGAMCALVFFGHRDCFEIPELEELRLELAADVNAHPSVIASGLSLPLEPASRG